MIDNTIFKITQLTTSVATILASAYVWINSNANSGFIFFIMGAAFTIILRMVEQNIFDYNCRNHYDHIPRY